MSNKNRSKKELEQDIERLKQEYESLKLLYEQKLSEKVKEKSPESIQGNDTITPVPADNDVSVIKELFEDYVRMYSGRDDLLTTYFSDNFSGFTGGGDFLVKDKQEWVAITRQDFAQVKEPLHLDIKDTSIQLLSDTVAVATSFFVIHLPIKDHILSRETARLVLIYHKESAGWKISHSSISIPYHLVREGEVYPLAQLEERNRFLEEMVEERTQQLSRANEDLQKLNEELAKNVAEHKLAEEALKQTNQKLNAILSASPDGIGTISLDGKIQFISDKLAEMYGYPVEKKDEFLGKQAFDFVDPSDHEKLKENIQKLYSGDRVSNIAEYLTVKSDNSKFLLEVNSTLLMNSNGKPESILLVERDITERRRKEEELQQSSRKWEALISASPDGIGMISVDGKIQLISDKLVTMHGYPVENKETLYYGRSIFDFIDPSSHKQLIENTKQLLEGEKSDKPTEYIAIRADGSRFIIDVKTSVIKDANGKPLSVLYVERDITERKRKEEELQQSNEKLEAIISSSPDGIGMISLDGKMILMSDQLLKIYGYSTEEKNVITGRSAYEFIAPECHAALLENIKKLLAGNKETGLTEYTAVRKDGSRFLVDVNSAVLHDVQGRPVSILFIERDITDRKRAEEEIKHKNIELAQVNATKDKFFSIIAHDLKSPFQGLLGLAQILSAEFSNLTEEEKISSIDSIHKMSGNTYKLLENLLDWARLQTGLMNLNPEYFNLYAGLENTVSLLRQTAQNKKIVLQNNTDKSLFIHADQNMLSTVVRNLVSNAVKFTNPGGTIVLDAVKTNGIIEISVSDNGTGIEKENIDKLFDVEKHVSRRGTANEQGTGLGLLLCKEMIEKHGGQIFVVSEPGKGSRFAFTIPDLE